MWRKAGLGLAALLVLGIGGFFALGPRLAEEANNRVRPHAPWAVSAEAAALHARLFVADMHADSLLWDRDLLERADYGHVDFPRLQEGNVGLQIFTAVTKVPAGQNYESNDAGARDQLSPLMLAQLWPPRSWTSPFQRARHQARRLAAFAASAPDVVMPLRSRADLARLTARRAEGAPLVGALLGMEGAHALEGSLENLDALYRDGYRLVGLQHFFDNEVGGSLHGQSGAGLTPFGRVLVQELERRGMVIDLAHASPAVARDTLALTDVPLVVSHTGIHSHCPHPRNFDDDLMVAIAASGGVIGIGFWSDVICDDSPDGIAAAIGAAIDLLGAEHVALGSDYDGSVTTTLDASELAALTDALLRAGRSEEEIALVMGGNLLRVLGEVLP